MLIKPSNNLVFYNWLLYLYIILYLLLINVYCLCCTLGRTHRSNQVSAPEYVFLISELAGEQRFASVVAKRLESLGALTHGDRRATESRDLSKYNIDTKYGRSALEIVLGSVVSQRQPIVHSEEYNKSFFESKLNILLKYL